MAAVFAAWRAKSSGFAARTFSLIHGGVNIVINTEQQGFAHSSYLVHGASAYAVGLKVPDASAAIERSRALGAEIFLPEANEGEGAMAAIRGIGGGLIYFLDEADDVWSREFVWSGATPQGASPLLAIDHGGLALVWR